ncbi:MAG: hypothetical protein U9R60_14010 [Bacteroidota bacterium]|nr:hypothetical protein [Bacteroidota bacterium]
MNNRFERVAAYVFVLVVLLLTCYLFLYDDFTSKSEAKITGIITFLALGFGVFQFWIDEMNADERKLYDLRYESYKDFVFRIDLISETLNYEMAGNDISSIHTLVSRMMNDVNRIRSAIAMNSDFLFPDLYLKPEAETIESIVGKILVRTDTFRRRVERAIKNENRQSRNFELSVEQMKWHNEIREYLNDLHQSKYDFYRILKTYL